MPHTEKDDWIDQFLLQDEHELALSMPVFSVLDGQRLPLTAMMLPLLFPTLSFLVSHD